MLRRALLSRSGLTFFGLTQEYRTSIFNQIHEIVFHGKGGYDWATVYNMPIWLRNFTFHKIKDYYDKVKEQEEKALNPDRQKLTPEISRPNIKPSYSTKASK